MNPGFVVAMGMGTVFVGLIAIILVCMLMSSIVRSLIKSKPEKASNYQAPKAPAAAGAAIADRENIVVAISAAIAEEIGEDAGAIRIVSLRQI